MAHAVDGLTARRSGRSGLVAVRKSGRLWRTVLFDSHPTGKMNRDTRLESMIATGGIANCGNAQNCVKVCPKGIPLTRSIAKLWRDTAVYAVKRWLHR